MRQPWALHLVPHPRPQVGPTPAIRTDDGKPAGRALDSVANDFEHQRNGVLDLTDRCLTVVNAESTPFRERAPKVTPG